MWIFLSDPGGGGGSLFETFFLKHEWVRAAWMVPNATNNVDCFLTLLVDSFCKTRSVFQRFRPHGSTFSRTAGNFPFCLRNPIPHLLNRLSPH